MEEKRELNTNLEKFMAWEQTIVALFSKSTGIFGIVENIDIKMRGYFYINKETKETTFFKIGKGQDDIEAYKLVKEYERLKRLPDNLNTTMLIAETLKKLDFLAKPK